MQAQISLPDRKALDDIVIDVVGLTEEERKEVYWTFAELVKNRLEKARSGLKLKESYENRRDKN